jgi:hypothetical protein
MLGPRQEDEEDEKDEDDGIKDMKDEDEAWRISGYLNVCCRANF